MDSISKKDFQEQIENTGIPADKTYYSFDRNDLHLIVLDANYSKAGKNYKRGDFDWMDSNIRPRQMHWLKKDLELTDKPTIVFIHQRLDTPNTKHKVYCVRNAEKVSKVLEQSGKVVAVFQGHDHEGDYSKINGIHYYTQVAMVSGAFPENNSFSIVEILGNGNIRINGFVNCESREMS